MGGSSPTSLSRGWRLFVFGSAVAAVIAAVTVTVRRRRATDGDASPSLTGMPALELPPDDQPASAPAPTAVTTPVAATTPTPAATSRTETGPAAARSAGLSRADLYRQAQAAGIKGRSKMTKAQLELALRENQT